MRAPFELLDPTGPETPVVVEIPHAGVELPAPFLEPLAAPVRSLGRDADLYVDALYEDAPALGASVVVARTSRYVVDVNRAEGDVDGEVVEGARSDVRMHHGLIWRTTSDGDPALARRLTAAELEERLELVWRPYHRALADLIALKRRRFGIAVVLAAHSMPSVERSSARMSGVERSGARMSDVERSSARMSDVERSSARTNGLERSSAGAGVSARGDPANGARTAANAPGAARSNGERRAGLRVRRESEAAPRDAAGSCGEAGDDARETGSVSGRPAAATVAYDARARADVVPGTRGRRSASGRFIDEVEAHATSFGWSVRHDDPYAGGFTTQHYGRPAEGVHVIQVELARRLYLNETTLRPNAQFAVTRNWCRDLVARLGRIARSA